MLVVLFIRNQTLKQLLCYGKNRIIDLIVKLQNNSNFFLNRENNKPSLFCKQSKELECVRYCTDAFQILESIQLKLILEFTGKDGLLHQPSLRLNDGGHSKCWKSQIRILQTNMRINILLPPQ